MNAAYGFICTLDRLADLYNLKAFASCPDKGQIAIATLLQERKGASLECAIDLYLSSPGLFIRRYFYDLLNDRSS